MSDKKAAIVTGAAGGIGAGLVDGFLKAGYNLVATSLHTRPTLTASPSLVLVDGDIGKQETATKTVEAAIAQFGTIDVLVNNAGIFYNKPFTDFTTEDFNSLVSTNLLGFLYITQLTVKQMLKQKSGSVGISAALADRRYQRLGFDDGNGSIHSLRRSPLRILGITRVSCGDHRRPGILRLS